MKNALVLIILFYSTLVSSKIVANYKYPFSKPYMATVLSALSSANIPYFRYRPILIDDYPHRKKQLDLASSKVPNVGLLMHKGKRRPLVFLLAGFAASKTDSSVRMLAYYLHVKLGFHVIAMPDQFNWYNALLTDKKLVLGDLPTDIQGYISLMKRSLQKTQASGLQFSDISIAGYSMGGLRSLFIAKQDKLDGFFNFKTVVAINPPISIFQAGKFIDKAYYQWKKYKQRQKEILINRAYAFLFKLEDQVSLKNKDLLGYVYNNFPYTESQAQALVGYTFLEKLTSYLEVSEGVNQTGAFAQTKEPFPYNLGVIFDYKTNFLKYFSSFLYPVYRKKEVDLSVKDFLYRSSLYSLENFLKNSSNVFIQHNKDDVLLLNPESDLNFLESLLKDKIIIYPYGGHLGNMWFPTNIQHFLSFFSK